MISNVLSVFLSEGLRAAQTAGVVADIPVTGFAVERRHDDHAHYSSAESMRLARVLGSSPRNIADAIVTHLPTSPVVRSVEAAGPGFINIWLDDEWVLDQIPAINSAGNTFGHTNIGNGLRVQVEFVSANPTGPLTAGAGRGGVVGDALARLLETCGYDVTREYYVNDAGYQIEMLGLSVYHYYAKTLGQDTPFPSEGYKGDYISAWGRLIADEDNDQWLGHDTPNDVNGFEKRAIDIGLDHIRCDLDELGIKFDTWFSEKELRTRGSVNAVIQDLEERGFVTHRDGATWFVGGEGVQDRENVLVRSRGDPTYFASDIAYHRDKFQNRGFDHVIDIWGADHHGHVPRIKAAMEAIGVDVDGSQLEILVTQMVGIRADGELARQGKRSGKFITLRELLDEVGPAATRFFFLSKAIDSQMEFDLELAKREDPENPVYYIQMAHARCAGIERTAASRNSSTTAGDATLIADDVNLTHHLLAYPEILVEAAVNREPHRIAHYLLELARAFHSYYNKNRVVTENTALTSKRIELVRAVRCVLANGLSVLGIEAPERM